MRANNGTAKQTAVNGNSDEAQAINRLLAINVMIEAARLGHKAVEFANLTEAMALLAPDSLEDNVMARDLIEKQTLAAREL